MPKFSYRAVNEKGRPVRGVIAAANETDLFNRLNDSNLALVSCKEMNEKASKFAHLTAKRVKVRDLVQLFVHLEQLQKAGVPLLDALADVRDTTESTRLRDVMSDIYNEVSEGSSSRSSSPSSGRARKRATSPTPSRSSSSTSNGPTR
jgi:type IV pilus assembly protein PilC